MMTFLDFIKAFFAVLLLTQCNSKVNNTTVAPLIAVTQNDNALVGEWKYNNTIWYSSELTLDKDGTFTYHDQSCTGQRFSKGEWRGENGSVLITSFDNFKEKGVVDPKKTPQLAQGGKPKKGKAKYTFTGFTDTTSIKFPTSTDTVRIYLSNIQLQLRNDTLVCVSSNKLPEEAKFYRTRNNR
jgi:hypothetical protein